MGMLVVLRTWQESLQRTRVADVETSDLRHALLVAFATQMW